jgi:transposase
MRPPLHVRARGRQLRCLQKILRRSPCPRARLRAQMVLLSHQGYSLQQIAAITRQSDETVRRWLHRFHTRGCPGLREAPRPGRPPTITPAVEQLLHEWAQLSPRAVGVHRPAWTTANLARLVERLVGVRVTAECIRQHLHRLDFVCRRPTWTVKHLARLQPGYAQKKGPLPGCCGTRRAAPTSTCRTRPN